MATKIVFNATNGIIGSEPWISDGTDAGTVLLSDILAGSGSGAANGFFDLGNGRMVFSANNGVTGAELWVTDGTAAGTSLLRDIRTLPASLTPLTVGSSAPASFFSIAPGRALFRANDGTNGSELWVTDGTAGGTSLLMDINPGTVTSGGLTTGNNGAPTGFVAAPGGRTLFTATQGASGSELWVTDGTTAGTSLLMDINPGAASSSPQNFVTLPNGNLLFTATTPTTGRELWITDGTTAGTSLVKEIVPGAADGLNTNTFGIAVGLGNGKVLFGAVGNDEPWVSDGTSAGTYQLKDIRPGASSSLNAYGQTFSAVGGGKALFSANDGTHGLETWITDGTSAGTSLLTDAVVGAGSSSPSGFTQVPGGKAVFSAIGPGTAGRELWVTDMTSGGTSQLLDIFPGTLTKYGSTYTNNGSPTMVGRLNDGRALFTAADATHGRELWVTDGTVGGTSMVKDINSITTFNNSGPATPASSNPASFVPLGDGRFAFTANDGLSGTELWITDGTAAGTNRAGDINMIDAGSNTQAPVQGRGFVPLGNGKVTFVANDGIHGNELWVTDLTAGGTSLLKDINPGANNGGPSAMLAIGGGREMFNALSADGSGRELWITDGTAAGTSLLKDIDPVTNHSSGASPTLVLPSGAVLMSANDGVNGGELWISDGTASGTSLLKDINPGSANSYPNFPVAFGGGALFGATTAAEGRELWFTDGTAAGTGLVKDINPGTAGSNVSAIMTLGSKAIFTANDGTTGSELWVTDGTTGGTSLLMDIQPGSSYGYANSGYPTNFTALGNGSAVFNANDGVHGGELWVTDGTASGTSMLRDIYPGSFGGANQAASAIGGGKAIFGANEPGSGFNELWITDGTTAGTSMVFNFGNSGSFPAYMTPVGNGLVVFAGGTTATGTELWVTDGTGAHTSLLRDFNPGTGNSFPTAFRATGDGHVIFDATDAATGHEPWVTDGTAAGTSMIKDINTITAASSPAAMTVFHTNDAPVAHGIADQSTNEDSPFSFAIPAGAFTDANPWDPTLAVSATLNGGGVLPAWLSFNPVTQMFSGTPDDPDVGTISVKVTATDSFGKTAANAFNLTVVDVNDPPVVLGAVTGQTTTDTASLNPMSAMTITDQDAGASEVVTLTLTGAGAMPTDANGTLSGVGLIKTGTGTYTMAAGSPAAVTAALEAVTFTPAMNEVAPGQTVTTGIAVAVNDGTVTVTDTTTTVIATSVNDAPVVSVAGPAQAGSSGAIRLFAGVTIGDPDFGAQDRVTITLRNSFGTPTDANGTLAGSGLAKIGAGTYLLPSTNPAALTQKLEALLFTPASGGNASVATSVTLSASDGMATTVFSGFNTMVKGNGNASITGAPGGYSTVSVGNGNATVALGGGYNTVTVGNGNATVTGAPGGFTSVSVGNGNLSVNLGGGSNTIVAGNGNATITGSPGGFTTVTLGNGNALVNIGGTNDIITLGNGNNQVIGTQGMAFIKTGNGNDTINAGGSFNTFDAGGGNNIISGGIGNDIFMLPKAGQGFDTISGFSELNDDVLDLRTALAATNWNGGMASLGNYLKVAASGGNTTLSIATNGNGGGTGIAMLKGAGNLGLSDLLAHNSLRVV